ncbi:MAG TPA: glycosyltransferase, partial [Nitrososphaerales archaeon]|nr:glycosyltransferase [Nitrososphaerales archaeon]
ELNPENPSGFIQGMVTILITTYNRAGYLPQCIDSALAQDHPSFEVMVVDDGSTDGTAEVCKRYGKRIRYFWKPNGGAPSALNFGIQRMRGEWLKVLDSDDLLERKALSTFAGSADMLHSDWLFSNCVEIDSDGRLLRVWRPKMRLTGEGLLRALWSMQNPRQRLPFSSSALGGMGFIRRGLLFRLGLLDEGLSALYDWEWVIRAALVHGSFGTYVPLPLYRYRHHRGQMTGWTWEVKRAHEERARKAIRRRMSRTTEVSGPVLERYRRDARRLRRMYLPLIALERVLGKAPSLQKKGRILAWTVAPSLMDRVYWGENPPVDAGPDD